ncbi:MAG TPA: hypothetical protein VHT29_13830 [Solirubrobacteraceae bacterium]|jgi:hypothetical protein|nr:hypothetical protein [Solirubrobacteraceae bacterium]
MLAHLVSSVRVETVPGTQLLEQLASKLGLFILFSLPDFKLFQPITSATDHQVVELHTLPPAAKGIQGLTHGGGLGDRMARMTSGHASECSTRYSTVSNTFNGRGREDFLGSRDFGDMIS